jgi:ribonuclease HI
MSKPVIIKIIKEELKIILSTEYKNTISLLIFNKISKNHVKLDDNLLLCNIINSILVEYLNIKYASMLTTNIIKQFNILVNESKPSCKSEYPTSNTNIQTKNDIIVFTDGACSSNGSKTAIAGCGILFDNNIQIHKANDHETFTYNSKNRTLSDPNTSITYYNSNIRAEGYAILYTMWIAKFRYIDNWDINNSLLSKLKDNSYLYPMDSIDLRSVEMMNANLARSSKNITITIVTDSKFWIDMLDKYIPSWIIKDIYLEKKNCDLVIYMIYIKSLLKSYNINIVFRHVRAHTTSKQMNADEVGNDIADKLAVRSKLLNHFDFILEITK